MKNEEENTKQRRPSMHEDVPLWDDTPCCCEPEPRWQAVEDERLERERSAAESGAEKETSGQGH
jgi:hypothetical protein